MPIEDDSADCPGLCPDSRGMAMNMHDAVVLLLFAAWFLVVMLSVSGSPEWAAGFTVPLAVVTAILVRRAMRGRVTSV